MPVHASIVLAGSFWPWLQRLGGPGLILLGVLDNSAIPLPGSMDLLVILLSAHHREWWPYYAMMATAGAIIGGYLTYRLAEKGGEGTLEKRVGKRRAEKVYKRFKQHGFATVAVGAMLPPPFPIVSVSTSGGRHEISTQPLPCRAGSGSSRSLHRDCLSRSPLWQRNHWMGITVLPPSALHLDWSSGRRQHCRARVLQVVSAQA